MSNASAPRAFTLIELILAVGVTAIVLTAVNAVFFSALRLQENTTSVVDESLPIQHTLSVLRRDLQGATPPPTATEGVLSGGFRAGGVVSLGLGQPVDIEFNTTTGVLRDTEPWGEVQRVAYQLRLPENRLAVGQDLVRSVTRNLLALLPQPEDQLMMSGVESIEFACYDGIQWRTEWDTTELDTALPTAVRVRILLAATDESAEPRPIEMVVPIHAQSGTNQTSSAESTGG